MVQMLALLLVLLVAKTTAQPATNLSASGSLGPRFVAQVNVKGCLLFVHDTGASDGPHLGVDPFMCAIGGKLRDLLPRFDAVTQQVYVSVPVLLRDDDMLEQLRRKLAYLPAFKSLHFANVTDVSVSMDSQSRIKLLAVVWDVRNQRLSLRLGCKASECLSCFDLFQDPRFALLPQTTISAWVTVNGKAQLFNYRLQAQNQSYVDHPFNTQRYSLPECRMEPVRYVSIGNCTVRVHQRMEEDRRGEFYLEPLLCHNISSLSSESVLYDYSRDRYYLNLDLQMWNESAIQAASIQLADLEPRIVKIMRMWRARSEMSEALAARFEVGELMLDGWFISAQLPVYCKKISECHVLLTAMLRQPADFWLHLPFSVTGVAEGLCVVNPGAQKTFAWKMDSVTVQETKSMSPEDKQCTRESPTQWTIDKSRRLPDGRLFLVIQQRISGDVSFQRNWTEYEKGFGDDNDFWIGLQTIHQQTSPTPRLLRVEAITLSNTKYVAEYSNFSVSDARSQYRMTFGDYLRSSNTTQDSLNWHKGMKFSTKDRDNDRHGPSHCSQLYGLGGWWFNSCAFSNPNGLYYARAINNGGKGMSWYGAGGTDNALKSIRLMLLLQG